MTLQKNESTRIKIENTLCAQWKEKIYVVLFSSCLQIHEKLSQQEKQIFNHPSLTLSTGHSIEAGVCSMHQIKELNHRNKTKLIYNVIIFKKTAYQSNLGKLKVELALIFFVKN